jgi:hypothetical protein
MNPHNKKYEVTNFYLESMTKDTEIIDSKGLQVSKKWVVGNIDRIENDKEYKKRKSFLCSWCAYSYLCEDSVEKDNKVEDMAAWL